MILHIGVHQLTMLRVRFSYFNWYSCCDFSAICRNFFEMVRFDFVLDDKANLYLMEVTKQMRVLFFVDVQFYFMSTF
jgi:hypothetical protein